MQITDETVLRQRRDLRQQHSLALLGYETIPAALADPTYTPPPAADPALMLSNHGELFQLNLVAGFVWDSIDGGRTVDGLVSAVTATFDTDRDRADLDVKALLRRMDDLDLVRA